MAEDDELIKACQQGKHVAFEALYNKYARRMMAIALRYCNTTFEAEDIIQETFIKVFEKIKTYEHKGSFEGWLKRVIINHSINHYHKTHHDRHNEDSSQLELSSTEPESDVMDRLSNQELLNLMRQLPEGYRLVLNLYVIEGYSHKEISEMLNISEGTSKSQLFKAKAQFKELLIKFNLVSNE